MNLVLILNDLPAHEMSSDPSSHHTAPRILKMLVRVENMRTVLESVGQWEWQKCKGNAHGASGESFNGSCIYFPSRRECGAVDLPSLASRCASFKQKWRGRWRSFKEWRRIWYHRHRIANVIHSVHSDWIESDEGGDDSSTRRRYEATDRQTATVGSRCSSEWHRSEMGGQSHSGGSVVAHIHSICSQVIKRRWCNRCSSRTL